MSDRKTLEQILADTKDEKLREALRDFYLAGRKPKPLSGDAEFHSCGGK